jgi:hypothetical protein
MEPPDAPRAENPRPSACSTSAKPSAPGAAPSTGGASVKLTRHGAVRSSGAGAHAAFAWSTAALVISSAPPHREGSTCVAPSTPASAKSEKSTAGGGAQGAAQAVTVAADIACAHTLPPVPPVKPQIAVPRLPSAALRLPANVPR